jgi:hypothetical protein
LKFAPVLVEVDRIVGTKRLEIKQGIYPGVYLIVLMSHDQIRIEIESDRHESSNRISTEIARMGDPLISTGA